MKDDIGQSLATMAQDPSTEGVYIHRREIQVAHSARQAKKGAYGLE